MGTAKKEKGAIVRSKKTVPEEALRKRAEKRLKLKPPLKSDKIDQSPLEVQKLVHELQVHQIELEMQNDELRNAQFDLARYHRRYADLFNFAPIGYVVLDTEGTIRETNSTAISMFRRTKNAIIGTSFRLNVYEPDRAIFAKHLREALSRAERPNCIVRMKSGHGRLFHAQIESVRLEEEELKAPACLTAITDISKIKELEKELEEHVKDLESFTYAASHELRGPLVVIAGFSNILTKEYPQCLDEEKIRMLTSISENARKMERLLTDLREFSQVSVKEITLDTINMESLFRSAYSEVQPGPGERQVAFTLGKLPPARGDMAMLRQVLVNLLSNALKFSGGRERAEIVVQGQKGKGENIYSVKDNGVGFDMHYADKLFKVFQRLHGSNEFPGTGAGLSIARRIIEKHGGRIWAQSGPDLGATFYFTLPAREPGV